MGAKVINRPDPLAITRAGPIALAATSTRPTTIDAARGHVPTQHHDPDPLPTREHACRSQLGALAGIVPASDTIAGAAARALSPRYNERLIGAHASGPDRITVIFNACRGVETDRGLRYVDLVASFVGPRERVWSLESVQFMKVADELTSRRGHVASSI